MCGGICPLKLRSTKKFSSYKPLGQQCPVGDILLQPCLALKGVFPTYSLTVYHWDEMNIMNSGLLTTWTPAISRTKRTRSHIAALPAKCSAGEPNMAPTLHFLRSEHHMCLEVSDGWLIQVICYYLLSWACRFNGLKARLMMSNIAAITHLPAFLDSWVATLPSYVVMHSQLQCSCIKRPICHSGLKKSWVTMLRELWWPLYCIKRDTRTKKQYVNFLYRLVHPFCFGLAPVQLSNKGPIISCHYGETFQIFGSHLGCNTVDIIGHTACILEFLWVPPDLVTCISGKVHHYTVDM